MADETDTSATQTGDAAPGDAPKPGLPGGTWTSEAERRRIGSPHHAAKGRHGEAGDGGPGGDQTRALRERFHSLLGTDRVHVERGHRAWLTVGVVVFLLGLAITVHGYYATANAVLDGKTGRAAEQLFTLGPIEVLESTLGLFLAAVGGGVALAFLFVPVRVKPNLKPDTLEYYVTIENLVRTRDMNRMVSLVGLGILAVGVLLTALALRETAQNGAVYELTMGDLDYRVHFWGYTLLGVGALLFVPLALRQGVLNDVVTIARAHAHQVLHGDEAGDEEPAAAKPRGPRPAAGTRRNGEPSRGHKTPGAASGPPGKT